MRIRNLASKKAQNLERVLKLAPYILAYHLQTDADPDTGFHFDADPDPAYYFEANQESGSSTLILTERIL